MIPNGASLFIDIGTTPEAVANALLGHEKLRIVTNNLNAAHLYAKMKVLILLWRADHYEWMVELSAKLR